MTVHELRALLKPYRGSVSVGIEYTNDQGELLEDDVHIIEDLRTGSITLVPKHRV